MLYIIDTYAWVEYLIGSKKGGNVKKVLNDRKNQFITLSCCLGELRGWCLKEKNDFNKVYYVVRSNSGIEEIHTNDWVRAAEIRHEKRANIEDFGFIDSLILTKQEKYKCEVISGDKHFRGLRNVVYVGD